MPSLFGWFSKRPKNRGKGAVRDLKLALEGATGVPEAQAAASARGPGAPPSASASESAATATATAQEM